MKKVVLVALVLMTGIELIAMTKNNRVDIGSEAEFNSTIQTNPMVVALFSTASCEPCKKIKPLVEALTKEMQNVVFAYIDGDNKSISNLVDKYATGGFPTIKVFKNGEEVGEVVGAKTKPGLRSAISQHLGLTITSVAPIIVKIGKPAAKKKPVAKKPTTSKAKLVKAAKPVKPAKASKDESESYEETITEEYYTEEVPSGEEEETLEEGEEVEESSDEESGEESSSDDALQEE